MNLETVKRGTKQRMRGARNPQNKCNWKASPREATLVVTGGTKGIASNATTKTKNTEKPSKRGKGIAANQRILRDGTQGMRSNTNERETESRGNRRLMRTKQSIEGDEYHVAGKRETRKDRRRRQVILRPPGGHHVKGKDAARNMTRRSAAASSNLHSKFPCIYSPASRRATAPGVGGLFCKYCQL